MFFVTTAPKRRMFIRSSTCYFIESFFNKYTRKFLFYANKIRNFQKANELKLKQKLERTEHEMIWLCHVKINCMAFQTEQQHERLKFFDWKEKHNFYRNCAMCVQHSDTDSVNFNLWNSIHTHLIDTISIIRTN